MSTPGTTNSTNSAIPTAAQLADARLKQWHQQGEALLTIENLRSWINAAGLVLFTPRPQIASPAPSLVEAVLGAPNPSPTLDQSAEARSLLARLIAEGLAVPLNLLGAVNGVIGETPDFVASAAVFSYVFTLRGDKAWKQPPATTGAVKVSHLALATHEALTRRGPLTAYDLTTEVGKEVTEAAVLRALGELWTQLRVLPLPQPDGRPTIWELSGTRFTKQIKAGANAGQPSALSALISLYLGQAVVASEDEIESFLSPLASRSRIRDVIHALLAARQLETLAVEGRTVLHVAGELPAFLAPEPVLAPSLVTVEVSEIAAESGATDTGDSGEAPRITKYVPKPRKVGTGYLAKAKPAKFASKPFSSARPDGAKFGPKPGFKSSPKTGFTGTPKPRTGAGAGPDRERRPFSKPSAPPRKFDKPWDEGKPRRPFVPRSEGEAGDARPPRKTFSKPGTFGRKREGFDTKPKFGGKPAFDRESRPPRRDFAPRPDRGDGGTRPAFGGARSSSPRPRPDRPQGDRPPRAEGSSFAPRKTFGARPAGGGFAKRPGFSKDKPAFKPREFKPREGEGQNRFTSTESGKRVYRKFDSPRDRGDRPARTDRPARSFSSDRPARPEGGRTYSRKPAGDFAPRKSTGRPAGKPGGFAGKSDRKPGGFGGKKTFSKSGSGGFAGKPTSTFAKFAGGKKPFGKRPPARKFKPKDGDQA